MKFDVTRIIRAHFKSLRDAETNKVAFFDVAAFYLVPIALAIVAFVLQIELPEVVLQVSISVFSIFSALLISAQVAMYGVFSRHVPPSDDNIENEVIFRSLEEERVVLKETNSNVSYLILISCISVCVFVVFIAANIHSSIEASVTVMIYLHFLVNLLMAIKRIHILFDVAYSTPRNKPEKLERRSEE